MERTKTHKKGFFILASDPSLTGWGWVVLNKYNRILASGCIKTKPDHKKRRIRKGDDTVRRGDEYISILLDVINLYKVSYIVTELPHGSQNSAGAMMIGLVIGIFQTISRIQGIPIEWYSEGDAKQALLHKNSATKREIIDQIDKNYKVPWTGIKYQDEAIADSLAIHFVATKQSQTLQFLKI